MKAHVPGSRTVTTRNRAKWKSAVYKIKQWVYSWMKPGYVETAEEYKISKFLLLQFVCAAPVLASADGNMFMILSMMRFLQGYVFVYEDLYLHYKRRELRHYDVAHASPHEVRQCLLQFNIFPFPIPTHLCLYS